MEFRMSVWQREPLPPESSCRPDLYQSSEVTRLTVLSSSNFVIKVKEIWVLILLKGQQCRKFGGRRRYNKNGRSPRVERISLLQSSLPTLASRKSYCQDFRIFIFIFRPPLQDYGNNFQKTGLTMYLPVLWLTFFLSKHTVTHFPILLMITEKHF